MKTSDLNYNQKVVAISLLAVVDHGCLSKTQAIDIFSKTFEKTFMHMTCGIGQCRKDLQAIFADIRRNYRLNNGTLYYLDSETQSEYMWCQNDSAQFPLTRDVIASCEPEKQGVIRRMANSLRE